MNRDAIGCISVATGGLLLSAQLYGLKFIQLLEMKSGVWKTSAYDYIGELPVGIAIGLSAFVILFGIMLILCPHDDNRGKRCYLPWIS